MLIIIIIIDVDIIQILPALLIAPVCFQSLPIWYYIVFHLIMYHRMGHIIKVHEVQKCILVQYVLK